MILWVVIVIFLLKRNWSCVHILVLAYLKLSAKLKLSRYLTLIIHLFTPLFDHSDQAFHPCCGAYFSPYIPFDFLLCCLVDKLFSGPFSHSHSQALDCCSTLMACLSEEGCQSLQQKRHLRSWSILRDNLWCQSFLSQMQGTASDKQKQTSSLISWEYLWVVKLQKLVDQLTWCPLAPLLLTSPNTSSISRSHKIKSSCPTVHWGCSRSFMTNVCWCQDRDQSWKLLKSILECCLCKIFILFVIHLSKDLCNTPHCSLTLCL